MIIDDDPCDNKSESIGFCVAGGEGRLGRLATYCIRSIARLYPDAPKLVFLQEAESPPDILRNEDVSIVRGEFVIDSYPISAKVNALVEAEARFETDWVCLLDADTLLVERLTLPSRGEIGLVPVFIGGHGWGSYPIHKWSSLYSKVGVSLPEKRIHSISDNCSIIPYYNAGVVLSRTHNLGKKWRGGLIKISNQISKKRRFRDQIALSIVANGQTVSVMSKEFNFPAFHSLIPSASTRVVHYRRPRWFLRLPQYDNIVSETGIYEEFPFCRNDPRMIPMVLKSVYYSFRAKYPKESQIK